MTLIGEFPHQVMKMSVLSFIDSFLDFPYGYFSSTSH